MGLHYRCKDIKTQFINMQPNMNELNNVKTYICDGTRIIATQYMYRMPANSHINNVLRI